MEKEKIIKDNVHGYIHINENYFNIIDTALFQRLKNIKQTSYSSLYPSSTHDRFMHSLGTYYLGKQVIESVWNNLDNELNMIIERVCDKKGLTFTFEMACLLHDVGHAPFSHTGENFYSLRKIDESLSFYSELSHYIEKNRISNFSYIDGMLINELSNIYSCEDLKSCSVIRDFVEDYRRILRANSAKPHEKISALLGLSKFNTEINAISKKSKAQLKWSLCQGQNSDS